MEAIQQRLVVWLFFYWVFDYLWWLCLRVIMIVLGEMSDMLFFVGGEKGFFGWSVQPASETARWEHSRFCDWGYHYVLWWFWESPKKHGTLSVSYFSLCLALLCDCFIYLWTTWFGLLCREQVPADFKQIDAHAHQYKGSSARLLY